MPVQCDAPDRLYTISERGGREFGDVLRSSGGACPQYFMEFSGKRIHLSQTLVVVAGS